MAEKESNILEEMEFDLKMWGKLPADGGGDIDLAEYELNEKTIFLKDIEEFNSRYDIAWM